MSLTFADIRLLSSHTLEAAHIGSWNPVPSDFLVVTVVKTVSVQKFVSTRSTLSDNKNLLHALPVLEKFTLFIIYTSLFALLKT